MPYRTMIALLLGGLVVPPAFAQDTLVDYRDERMLDFADPAQWSGIAEKIGTGLEVLGEVSGSFTGAGAEEVAYLVSDDAAVAADPFPELNQRLVVFSDGEQVAEWALPEDGGFSRPVIAADLDGDGIDEVVLEGSFYNMGTLAVGVSTVKLGETAEILQTLPEVYVDSCDAGVGEKSISASVLRVVDGQIVAEAETLDCT